MSEVLSVAALIISLLLMLAGGVWVGVTLLGVGALAMMLFTSRPFGDAMATAVWSSTSGWSLVSLPLFIWMGEILFRTRLSEDLFAGLSPLLRRLPGGLLHVNIAGCASFSAISGSSAATLTTVGKISVPELEKRDYPDFMTYGTLAGAGTLGLLIPPSIVMIVYGVAVQESIADLFIAGIVPGLLLTLMFGVYIFLWGMFTEQGKRLRERPASLREKLEGIRKLFPLVLLVGVVIGSIYLGIASPTEAAVLGVLGSLGLAVWQRKLSWQVLVASLEGAVRTSAMIALLLAGSAFLTLGIGFSGIPNMVVAWISTLDISVIGLIFSLVAFYIVLGCFLDGISSIVLTMVVVEPIARHAGIDMIWFGIFVVFVAEMAMITPPVGFNLFLVQNLTGKDLGFIAKAALPMFLIMFLCLCILIFFPDIALWLPSHIRG
ncbi:TRAP transporter large permease subunit [Halomonas sp. MCCC 1A11036]|uniref:TRAP transporter large permease protein n=1 Tax=Billgrantia zhangzhouensis TaxID=2733481 RepID=A0ABS9AFR2_9GAMM|nr:TRAP transporter large permease subunit [Halomonas zhangzhouensis]MCE8020528.1 TRAP transporter large permease subunit [Halomonas zhangzhouensis]